MWSDRPAACIFVTKRLARVVLLKAKGRLSLGNPVTAMMIAARTLNFAGRLDSRTGACPIFAPFSAALTVTAVAYPVLSAKDLDGSAPAYRQISLWSNS